MFELCFRLFGCKNWVGLFLVRKKIVLSIFKTLFNYLLLCCRRFYLGLFLSIVLFWDCFHTGFLACKIQLLEKNKCKVERQVKWFFSLLCNAICNFTLKVCKNVIRIFWKCKYFLCSIGYQLCKNNFYVCLFIGTLRIYLE